MKKTLYVVIILLCATFVIGAIPDTLNIHGKLLNNGGSPQTGIFNMNFSIYDVSSGGSNIYTQTQNVTTDENGIYTLILSGLNGVDFEQDTWLGITVESDSEMTPRINLTSVPSSLAGAGSSLWSETGSDIYYDSGDVGIGISTPSSQLEIDSTTIATTLTLDNNAGEEDVMIQFQNAGGLEWSICMDDSITTDNLEFVRGGDCNTADLMSLTPDGLQFGNGRIYFGRSTSWSTTTISSRFNNQFTVRNLAPTSVSAIQHFVNGMPIFIICNDAVTTFVDQGFLGNLQLAGNFVCGIGDSLTLIYNDVLRDWIEVSRSNN